MKERGYSEKFKGAVNKVKGEAKDQFGNATDDAMLQAEGKLDKLKGEAQQEIGEFKDRFGNYKNERR
ncbi:CsbD family protein [Sporosarcina sp. 179-K 8C2 HS]|uniref:CsbD family protein n=1 Tax=Sporosarcina sp. 179-K 8C2 HS TaxID=3142387 RepID=UPI0039A32524